ncbi:hypothetical protein GGH93_004225 [Coemansia aciculifera]|nr:hypothetical protein GGH93_004225 [Coemansia aciculifera]
MCDLLKRVVTVLTLLTRKRRRGKEPEDAEALTPPTTTSPEALTAATNTYDSVGPQIDRDAALPLPGKSAMSSKVSRVPGSASPKKKVRLDLTPIDTPKPRRDIPPPEWKLEFLEPYNALTERLYGYTDLCSIGSSNLFLPPCQQRSIDEGFGGMARVCMIWYFRERKQRFAEEAVASIEAALNIVWRNRDVKEIRKLNLLEKRDLPTDVDVVNAKSKISEYKIDINSRRTRSTNWEYGHMRKKRAVCGGDTDSFIVIFELDELHIVGQAGTGSNDEQLAVTEARTIQPVALRADGEQSAGPSTSVVGKKRRACQTASVANNRRVVSQRSSEQSATRGSDEANIKHPASRAHAGAGGDQSATSNSEGVNVKHLVGQGASAAGSVLATSQPMAWSIAQPALGMGASAPTLPLGSNSTGSFAPLASISSIGQLGRDTERQVNPTGYAIDGQVDLAENSGMEVDTEGVFGGEGRGLANNIGNGLGREVPNFTTGLN